MIKQPGLSFECSYPKTPESLSAVKTLIQYNPDFISFACHWPETPLSYASRLERLAQELPSPLMPHLVWNGLDEAALRQLLDLYQAHGIKKFLIVRGDPRPDHIQPSPFKNTIEVLNHIQDYTPKLFEAWVGADPNQTAKTIAQDLEEKIQAGAHGIITQGFFFPEYFSETCEIARAISADFPIRPGIFCIRNGGRFIRFCKKFGVKLPQDLVDRLSKCTNQPQELRNVGQEFIAKLCTDLLARGATHLHFFTFNDAQYLQPILEKLSSFPESRS